MADIIDNREHGILSVDRAVMLKEFTEGKQVGDISGVPKLDEQFSWKRTFVNCWTGNPNAGKSTFLSFMAVVKSHLSGWKWCIWSREMINSYNDNGKVRKSSSDIIDELVHMYTGLNPYKHFSEKFNLPQIDMETYLEALDWVEDHFVVIDPKDIQYKSLIDQYMYVYEKHGIDGWILDPFKNVVLPDGRTDEILHRAFDDFKECVLVTNTTGNIIAHPKSVKENINRDGSPRLVDQFDLSGGAAWNNSMDGIFSVYRPFMNMDSNDRRMYLYHLKQRKKHLVGLTGVYKLIEFDWRTNRYYFDGYCPIDGSYLRPIGASEDKQDHQTQIVFNSDAPSF